MNRDELRNVLIEKLRGKEFSTYCQWDIRDAIQDAIAVNPDFLTYRREGQTVYIRYKGHSLIYMDVKKQKGDRHYLGFGSGSYCDWTYKDFEVFIYDYVGTYENPTPEETRQVEEQIPVIENIVARENAQTSEKFNQAVDAFKLLKNSFNIADNYEVRKLCEYISKEYYSIVEQNVDK